MTRILVVDNFDSFVYTINGYLRQLGAETTVVRNNVELLDDPSTALNEFDGVLLSPGPGKPAVAGASIPLVHAAINSKTPLLGVCLGHQALAEALGGEVRVAEQLMHGKTSSIHHNGSVLFEQVPQPFNATRYHSLAVVTNSVPEELQVTATTQDGVIMALEHKSAPAYGVQFHPESVLTEGGYQILGNWLAVAGLTRAREIAHQFSPLG
ncbi:MAG: aminodeoxychorismate/anthranilate synthase component II [Cryobacterium sp.]|nr:aminodeoxychorismate/anthranilate synthase component II [Cryobacterium sp.]